MSEFGDTTTVWKKAYSDLCKTREVLVTCHSRPDTDAYSSVLAFSLFAADLGVKADMAFQGYAPAALELASSRALPERVDTGQADLSRYGFLVVLDTAVVSQLGGGRRLLAEARRQSVAVINIDHHEVNPGYGDLNLVDPRSAATCEILYDLFESVHHHIDKNLAQLLLQGVFGDTDVLRTYNVTSKTVRTAASLIDYGADRMTIIEHGSHLDFRRAQLWTKVLDKMQVVSGAENIVYSVADATLVGDDAEYEQGLDGVANFMRDLKGVDLAILFIQRPGEVKISFRSKSKVSSLAIAKEYGGGGHYAAAGCEFPVGQMDQVIRTVLANAIRTVRGLTAN